MTGFSISGNVWKNMHFFTRIWKSLEISGNLGHTPGKIWKISGILTVTWLNHFFFHSFISFSLFIYSSICSFVYLFTYHLFTNSWRGS